MPNAKIGERTSMDRFSNFIELKQKDQKLQLRFIHQDYYYDGKHFMKNPDGTWLVTNCSRINNELECENCEKYFEIIAPAKEIRAKMKIAPNEDEKAKFQVQLDEINKAARNYKPKITFYYPVLDRADGLAKVLKTTLSIRIKLEELAQDDNVLEYDYILKRTEKPGSDYYTIAAVDSKKTEAISEAEQAEIDRAKEWDLEAMVGGKKSELDLSKDDDLTEGLEVKDEAVVEPKTEGEMNENVNPDDIPF